MKTGTPSSNQSLSGTRENSVRADAVIHWLTAGLPNKLIAAELGISETAVKKRLSRLMSEHGVSNRTELVVSLLSEWRPPNEFDPKASN